MKPQRLHRAKTVRGFSAIRAKDPDADDTPAIAALCKHKYKQELGLQGAGLESVTSVTPVDDGEQAWEDSL
jgi:hypothetical protein